MDGGAWWATVHGVTESRTRLSDFTSNKLDKGKLAVLGSHVSIYPEPEPFPANMGMADYG